MKIDRNGIQDFDGDEKAERVCDNCSGDMKGLEGGYLWEGGTIKISRGGPRYMHKKHDSYFKVHVGLFKKDYEGGVSYDICALCICKALYEAGRQLRREVKVEDRVPGTPMPRQTKDSRAIEQWEKDNSEVYEKWSDVKAAYGKDEEIARLKKQLEEITAQKEEWRKLFGDQAIDFFGFLAKVEQAKAKNEGGLPLHDAFLKVGLTELYELAKTEANRTNDEFEDVLKETRSELERATDLHNLYESRYNDVCRQRDDAEFMVEVATEAAELAWGTVNTWSREELFEKAELAVHRRNKDKDNTIPF